MFSYLDKAALKESTGSSSGPPCIVTQVEGVKLVAGMFLIWLATLFPCTIWAQISTLFVKQGTTLDRTLAPGFHIPAASLGSFETMSMLISIPHMRLLLCSLHAAEDQEPSRHHHLQRPGNGFVIQVVAIAVAYAVEAKRMQVITANHITVPKDIVPTSILLLLPQYVLLGITDVFNAIGVLEFFSDQSPADMQSPGTTFFTSGIGVRNFMNSFLVTVVDRITARTSGKSWTGNNLDHSHLDYYYRFLLVLATINIGAFVRASNGQVYKRSTIVWNCRKGRPIRTSPPWDYNDKHDLIITRDFGFLRISMSKLKGP